MLHQVASFNDFHYKKDLEYNTSEGCSVLYQEVPENTLLNDNFCYFVDNLLKPHVKNIFKSTSPQTIATSQNKFADSTKVS